MKDNLYKNFSRETNSQKKAEYQTNSRHIGAIFPFSLDSPRTFRRKQKKYQNSLENN